MAIFKVGVPITTGTPSITVDAGLPEGVHRFQLEVIDSAGNRSAPDVVAVQVQAPVITRPVLSPTPVPNPIPVPDPVVTSVVVQPVSPAAPTTTRTTALGTTTNPQGRNRNPNRSNPT